MCDRKNKRKAVRVAPVNAFMLSIRAKAVIHQASALRGRPVLYGKEAVALRANAIFVIGGRSSTCSTARA